MAGYGQFCAVARALDVLGERWTMLVVRELLMGPAGFNDLRRGLPRISTATLSARLRALERAGIAHKGELGWELSASGAALAPVIRELARWASGPGALELDDDDLDPAALTWDMQRRVNTTALPDRKVVIELDFVDRSRDRRFWLHLDRRDVQLCRTDTGHPVDVWLSARTDDLTCWWLGEMGWNDVMARPSTTVTGDRRLVGSMPSWFLGYALAGGGD